MLTKDIEAPEAIPKPYQKYWAEVISPLKNEPGAWNSLRVGVFTLKDGKSEKVGEYLRNYHSLMHTFCWFTVAGKDYALYSKDYTSTRIMSLPDCRDIGGEDRTRSGFCPVDYYVPAYVLQRFTKDCTTESLRGHEFRVYEPTDEDLKPHTDVEIAKGLAHLPFGFIAGCVWGDDCSRKIQYLDLSEAAKGVLKRDERFGYIELPGAMRLKDAVDTEDYEASGRIRISTTNDYSLETGKRIDWNG